MEQLNLRVFRRTAETIALLFNHKALTLDQVDQITVKCSDKGKEKELKCVISDNNVGPDDVKTPDNTTLILVGHAANGLDPYTDYNFTLEFGSGSCTKISKILVYAFGVLPVHEKDSKSINRHSYSWCEEEKRWIKTPVVKLKNGTYAIPIVIVDK
jgi:hypothetical protein